MEGTALQRDEALVHELLAAVDDLRRLGAVLERALGDVRDVHLVDLAEIGRERVRDAALLTDPGDGHGRVEAAREGDADALADGQRLEDAAHRGSLAGVVTRRALRQPVAALTPATLRTAASSSAGAERALEPGPDHARPVDDEGERLALAGSTRSPTGSSPWPGRCPCRSRCG